MGYFNLFIFLILIVVFVILYKTHNLQENYKDIVNYPDITSHKTMNNKQLFNEKYCQPILPTEYPGKGKYRQNYFSFNDYVYQNSSIPDPVDKMNKFILDSSNNLNNNAQYKGQLIGDIYDKLTSPDTPINIS